MANESDDVRALHTLLAGARAIRIFDAGCLHYAPPEPEQVLGDEPVLVLTSPGQVAEVVALLAVEEVSDGVCMCPGDVTLEFLDVEARRLAVVGLHHGSHLRWSGWSGDAVLRRGPELLEWLSEQGLSGPLEDKQRADVRRHVALAQQAAWRRTIPACAQPLADEMLAAGPRAQEVANGVAEHMESAHPDDVERCRALLAWFSTGTAACTGYPIYEDFPGMLVAAMPIEVVLAALDGEPAGSPVWAGALRHIAGWKSRADWELRQVPADVWDTLLALGLDGGDSDKRQRIERKHAEFRPTA